MHLGESGFHVRGQQAEIPEQQDIAPRRIDMERTDICESISISTTT
jgi:hypothetical protein